MRRMGLKDVPHYAPDIDLTAVDYIEPISPEKRLHRAELQIDKFLKETSPDRFSGSFFDAYTEQEEKLLISLLEEQKTWHEGVNSSIALKHESELIRLRAEIKQAEDLIRKVDAEIDLLQAIYDRMNRYGLQNLPQERHDDVAGALRSIERPKRPRPHRIVLPIWPQHIPSARPQV